MFPNSKSAFYRVNINKGKIKVKDKGKNWGKRFTEKNKYMWRIINVLNLFWAFWPPRHFSQFSHSVVSDSLWPYGLQHVRLPCPSPTRGAYSNSCPSLRRGHPITSSSVVPFSFRLQSFPASGFFQMSKFFTLGGQSIGVSASASVLPMNIQKTKIMATGSITSCQIDGETMDTVTDLFWGLQNHCRWWLQPWN